MFSVSAICGGTFLLAFFTALSINPASRHQCRPPLSLKASIALNLLWPKAAFAIFIGGAIQST